MAHAGNSGHEYQTTLGQQYLLTNFTAVLRMHVSNSLVCCV